MHKKYKHMLAGMERKEKARKKRAKLEWSVYILRCCDGTLYTGIAKDIEQRLSMHNAGKGARYTRTRRPVQILYKENSMTRSQALSRECAIKTLGKKAKEKLVTQ